jgi:hypothetical protein
MPVRATPRHHPHQIRATSTSAHHFAQNISTCLSINQQHVSFHQLYLLSREATDNMIQRLYAWRMQNESGLLSHGTVIPLIPFSTELLRIGETIETVAYD